MAASNGTRARTTGVEPMLPMRLYLRTHLMRLSGMKAWNAYGVIRQIQPVAYTVTNQPLYDERALEQLRRSPRRPTGWPRGRSRRADRLAREAAEARAG
jgi:hypothetical protein